MKESGSLFFALVPDVEVRERIAQCCVQLKLQHRTPSPWVRAEQYHLKLPVIGTYPLIPEGWAERAILAAGRVSARCFELSIDEAGCSPKNRQIPWWLRPSAPPGEMKRLWRELRDALTQASIPSLSPNTRPAPHLTVVEDAQRTLPDRRITPLAWTVRDFVLIEGRPDSGHRILGRWALREGESDHARQFDLWDNPG